MLGIDARHFKDYIRFDRDHRFGENDYDQCTRPDCWYCKSINKGPVSTEIVITIAGGNEIVSSITAHSAESLKMKEGSEVFAIVKASEVMAGIA